MINEPSTTFCSSVYLLFSWLQGVKFSGVKCSFHKTSLNKVALPLHNWLCWIAHTCRTHKVEQKAFKCCIIIERRRLLYGQSTTNDLPYTSVMFFFWTLQKQSPRTFFVYWWWNLGNSGENSSRTPANVALTACAHKLVLPQLHKANCYRNSILYIVLVICFLLPLVIPLF